MASQLEAEIVSVTLLPVGNVALAAPAQQSNSIRTSDFDRSKSVWIADHLESVRKMLCLITFQL
jgi:hypothetical protein